jgi:hypothetical protein
LVYQLGLGLGCLLTLLSLPFFGLSNGMAQVIENRRNNCSKISVEGPLRRSTHLQIAANRTGNIAIKYVVLCS